jgi:cytochrome c5
MRKIQKNVLTLTVIVFVLSACLENKSTLPIPISTAEAQGGISTTSTGSTATTGGGTTTGTSTTSVSFVNDIMPMIKRECWACHQAPANSGGINLENYAQVKKYADNGKLYGSISGTKGFSKMPPNGLLASADIAKVKNWIDAGATNDTPTLPPIVITPPVVVTPPTSGSTITVDCPSGNVSVATNARVVGDEPKENLATTTGTATICFDTQVLPFFQSSCAFSGCHNAQSKKEGYDLSNYASIVSKGISKGNASGSKIYKLMIETGKDRMPPAPYPAIAKDKLDMIAKWINEGATNKVCGTTGGGTTGSGITRTVVVNFGLVNAIIQANCVSCHQTGFASAGINLDNYNSIKTYASNGRLYGSIIGATGYTKMPPSGQLSTCDIMVIKKWIDTGMLNN